MLPKSKLRIFKYYLLPDPSFQYMFYHVCGVRLNSVIAL